MSDSHSYPPDWAAFRSQMPVTNRWAYLDHAAVAPLSGPAHDAMAQWAHEAANEGAAVWMQWSQAVERVRQLAAQMVGAAADEIALVHNTTAGIGLVADGYPWQAGDNVVVPAGEFPSNLYPWMNLAGRGVETRRVPMDDDCLDPDRLAAACDERTRIVSVSWVGYADGWRSDVAALVEVAHDHGALLFLDAIQGLGVFPLDVEKVGVDFLAADGHKWMLGPEGAGIFYIRREHLDRIQPHGVGWHSVAHSHDFTHIELDFKPNAARFEGGSENMAGFIGLGASLRLLDSYGAAAIGERLLEITDLACKRLVESGATVATRREGSHRSGIVAFAYPGDMSEMRGQLLQDGVVVSYRQGRLRISPHAYTNEQDIERLVEALQKSR